MNGKENIINKILTDSDAKCSEILSAAETQAQAILDDANEIVKRDRAALEQRIDVTVAERKRNRVANAELDGKKYKLYTKQQLISRSYELAYEHLVKLGESDRLKLIGRLIDKYAEVGETVYVTKSDAKGVTQAWLNGLGKQLKLGKQFVEADGGIVLEGEGYDKDLTYGSIIRFAREQTEGKVAEILLGEHDE